LAASTLRFSSPLSFVLGACSVCTKREETKNRKFEAAKI